MRGNGKAISTGDGIAIDKLLAPSDAILFHAYPGGTGGTAIAESIYGLHNSFGRLTMTWLPKSFESSVDFSDFGFATAGRSYRYYQEQQQQQEEDGGSASKALFSFGEGMSFSDHTLSATALPVMPSSSGCELAYDVAVNTTAGVKAGDVVVMAFLVPESVAGLAPGTPLPKRQLVAAQRVTKQEDGSAEMLLTLDPAAVQLTDLDGSRALRTGSYTVVFSSGVASGEITLPLRIPATGCN